MLLNTIQSLYEVGEPIFSNDIVLKGVSDVALRQQFKTLCDKGILNRFDSGVYYLPKKSRLSGTNQLSSELVAKYKYISNKKDIFGYYSGYTFANQIGILTQVPVKEEIVSNKMAAIVRDIKLGNQSFIVRHSKIKITKENQKVLQLLDLLKDIDFYTEVDDKTVKNRITSFIQQNKITRKQIEMYITNFPLKTYKTIFDMRLEDVFA